MTVLRVAHRAANDPASLVAAGRLGADLAEGDVHLRRGRLELRHAKSLGPLRWEPWHLVPPTGVVLADLAPHLSGRPLLLLDLKAWQPWLGARVRDEMSAVAPGAPYAVCSRHWHLLDAFAGLEHVRTVPSVRTERALRRLPARLAGARAWGVALHASLVCPATVARLRRSVEVVLTWPVPDAAEQARLVAAGATGVIADDLGGLPAA